MQILLFITLACLQALGEYKMKITKNELRQLIKEELQKEGFMDSLKGAFGMGDKEEPQEPIQRPPLTKLEPQEHSMPKGFEGVQRDGNNIISGVYNGKGFKIEVDDRQSYGMAAMNGDDGLSNPRIKRLVKLSIDSGGSLASFKNSPTQNAQGGVIEFDQEGNIISENKQGNKTMTKKYSSDDKMQKLFEGFRKSLRTELNNVLNENEEGGAMDVGIKEFSQDGPRYTITLTIDNDYYTVRARELDQAPDAMMISRFLKDQKGIEVPTDMIRKAKWIGDFDAGVKNLGNTVIKNELIEMHPNAFK